MKHHPIGYDNRTAANMSPFGRLLRERGLLPTGRCIDAGDHRLVARQSGAGPGADAREILSYIFFKELSGRAVVARAAFSERATVGVDRVCALTERPVFLTLDRPEANGLWVPRIPAVRSRAQPLRHVLGRGGAEATVPPRNVGLGPCADPVPKAARRVRSLNPDEAELWARSDRDHPARCLPTDHARTPETEPSRSPPS